MAAAFLLCFLLKVRESAAVSGGGHPVQPGARMNRCLRAPPYLHRSKFPLRSPLCLPAGVGGNGQVRDPDPVDAQRQRGAAERPVL